MLLVLLVQLRMVRMTTMIATTVYLVAHPHDPVGPRPRHQLPQKRRWRSRPSRTMGTLPTNETTTVLPLMPLVMMALTTNAAVATTPSLLGRSSQTLPAKVP